MKKNKTLKISENFEYNPLNYLNENIEISYLMFEKPYKEAWHPFRKINFLEWNLVNLKWLIQLWNYFNVKDFTWWDNEINFNVISLLKTFFYMSYIKWNYQIKE